MRNSDGTYDLMKWDCFIPGKEGTSWQGVRYKVRLTFPPDFPANPPKGTFIPAIFHPNVYEDGTICISMLNSKEGWHPSLYVEDILLGIQHLIHDPNTKSPANIVASRIYDTDRPEYDSLISAQARRMAAM